jgi:hypothetical protein
MSDSLGRADAKKDSIDSKAGAFRREGVECFYV